MSWHRPRGARAITESDVPLYDLAWICTACGHIRLGPASIPEADIPYPPARRCPDCRAHSWHESALPARRFDGEFVDCLPMSARRASNPTGYAPTNPRAGLRQPSTPPKEPTQ